jgi:tetratricopeptide (TPR) repeat protein
MNRIEGLRRIAAPGAALLLAWIAATGCGDPELWARFRVERAMWRAARATQRITIQQRLAGAADYARAERRYRRIVDGFPAARWATPERLEHPMARDVARLSGLAALALGRLAEMQGQVDSALARYEYAYDAYVNVRSVALDAAVARATLNESSGRTLEAAEAWERVANAFLPVGDDDGRFRTQVASAPLRVAALERELGRESEALTALQAAVDRFQRVLAGTPPRDAESDLWDALARCETALGAPIGAIAAWRNALTEAPSEARAAEIRLAMAERWIEAGRRDSCFAVLAPLSNSPRPVDRVSAMLVRAHAWRAVGRVDSALVTYDAVIDQAGDLVDPAARARLERGGILERAGRWEEAQTEYRALSAAYPTHPLAFSAMVRIVEYHAALGQKELARIEGMNAIETLDRLILRQRDLEVQFEARRVRALLLLMIGPAVEACDAQTAFWRRYPSSPEGQEAGMIAASIADSALHDRARAVDLYREIAAAEVRTTVRERARSRLDRLTVQDGRE